MAIFRSRRSPCKSLRRYTEEKGHFVSFGYIKGYFIFLTKTLFTRYFLRKTYYPRANRKKDVKTIFALLGDWTIKLLKCIKNLDDKIITEMSLITNIIVQNNQNDNCFSSIELKKEKNILTHFKGKDCLIYKLRLNSDLHLTKLV